MSVYIGLKRVLYECHHLFFSTISQRVYGGQNQRDGGEGRYSLTLRGVSRKNEPEKKDGASRVSHYKMVKKI